LLRRTAASRASAPTLRHARASAFQALASAMGLEAAALTAKWEELKAQAGSPEAREKAMSDSKRWLGGAFTTPPGAVPAPAAPRAAPHRSADLDSDEL
jgi:hypothetical protein